MENKFPHKSLLPKPLQWSLGLLTIAVIFKLFNQLHADYDLWWHIFMGNEIIIKGTLDKFDVYSFTAYGLPYINHEWLSEIIMAWTYLVGKSSGLLIWRWSMALVILYLAFRLIRLKTQHPVARIIILLCFSLVLSPGISFRVQLFSYVLFLALLLLIYSAHINDLLPSVFVVSLLFVVWANVHGAFCLGLLIWFFYVTRYACQYGTNVKWQRILLYFLLPASATFINPFGTKLWQFIFHEISNPLSQKHITEWQRFSFAPREMPFFCVMTLTWMATFFSKRKTEATETIILIIASLMGLISVRHTPLFVILTLPSLSSHMESAFLRLLKRAGHGNQVSSILTYISSILFVGLSMLFIQMGLPDKWEVTVGKDPLPSQTIAFLEKNRVKGNLWVPLHYGGYVLFHLYPDIKVSIDGRWAMVYPRQTMQDNMTFAFQGTKGKWKQLLEKYGADLAIVETGNPAMKEMDQDADWIWIFSEKIGNLLIKKEYLSSLRQPLKIPHSQPPSWP
ncbi:MAG: hypothetical protein JSW04_01440 [Desulfobacterales bacterium]|nr:MAG: hypothetical protein JSW04_01440 [Desulfobacterales bacterium]